MKAEAPRSFAEIVGYQAKPAPPEVETHGTTVLALRYEDGLLLLADRRATMGNLVMYDHADKIFPLDDTTLVALSGSFARSLEICRLLKHSFKYYRRMQLSDMSLEGKLHEISKALASNLPAAMNGIGLFVPIVAAYDAQTESFGLYFFDGAGARFSNADYACAGSGSERIRGIFEYLGRTKKPWASRTLRDVLVDGLHMLDIAADLDSATGGFSKIKPMARILTKSGTDEVDPAMLDKAIASVLS